MNVLIALLLGIIQGLTEFLPVSSSGHLELAKALTSAENISEKSLLFTIVLHAATALSTLVVFRKDIGDILLFSDSQISNLLKKKLEITSGNIMEINRGDNFQEIIDAIPVKSTNVPEEIKKKIK